jgi:hypothetical protein
MVRPKLFNDIVYGIERCPQCGVATPLLKKLHRCTKHYAESDYCGLEYWYFTTSCSRCSHHVLFYGSCSKQDVERENDEPVSLDIERSFPSLEKVAEELPSMAAKFFQQAIESKHAPDGALMLAASAIDSMLKDKGFKEGSLYSRINSAKVAGLLTAEMEAWAHEIRLSANEPRHADDEFEGATKDDAEQSIAFAKALGEYLYVLPARVQKWHTKASQPSKS